MDADEAFGDEVPEWALEDGDDDYGEETMEDVDKEDSTYYAAEHVLLMIDCHPSMFERYIPLLDEETGDGQEIEGEQISLRSPMEVALEVAKSLFRVKIKDVAETKRGLRDALGVMLYNCNPYRGCMEVDNDGESDCELDKLDPAHIYIDLKPPGTEQALKFQNTDGLWLKIKREFAAEKGSKGDEKDDELQSRLQKALVEAAKIFEKSIRKKTNKDDPDDLNTIWIITNNDDPHTGDEDRKSRLIDCVMKEDLYDRKIYVHVMPLPKKAKDETRCDKFDKEVVYNSLVTAKNQVEDAELFEDTDGTRPIDMEVMTERLGNISRKQRKFVSAPLLLPGWKENGCPGIMLDLYACTQSKKSPGRVAVHQETNKQIYTKSIRVVEGDVKDSIPVEELHTYAQFGRPVSIHQDDVDTLKRLCTSTNDEKGLVLFGFKRMRTLDQIDHSHLMGRHYVARANPYRVEGSGKALYNLVESMKRKNVYGIGELVSRKKSISRMVAIKPGRNEGELLIMLLPFKEEIRTIYDQDIGFADRESVDAAKEMITKLTWKFDGGSFEECLPENPYLQHFFNYLESVSLGTEMSPVNFEGTQMDVEGMNAKAKAEIEKFISTLPIDVVKSKQAGKKRKADAAAKSPAGGDRFAKEPIGEEWKDRLYSSTIGALKNDELKAFLKGQRSSTNGSKADLVRRIEDLLFKHYRV